MFENGFSVKASCGNAKLSNHSQIDSGSEIITSSNQILRIFSAKISEIKFTQNVRLVTIRIFSVCGLLRKFYRSVSSLT